MLKFLSVMFDDNSKVVSSVVDKKNIDFISQVQGQFRSYANTAPLCRIDLTLHESVVDDLSDLATDLQISREQIVETLITSFLGYTVDDQKRLINVSPVTNKHCHKNTDAEPFSLTASGNLQIEE